MAQRKSSAKRGTSGKRRTSRKKSRKVKLNARAVFALAVTICVLSAAFLAFSFFTFANSDSSFENSVAAEKIFSPKKQTAEPKSEKKNQSQKTESSSSKTSAADKKVQSQTNETAVAKTNTVKNSSSETKTQNQKTESAVSKTTSATKTSATEKKVQSQVKEQPSVKTNTAASKTNTAVTTNSTETKNTDSHIASIGTVSAGDRELEEAKKKLFNIPPAVNGAKLCFVIDDAGENVANVKKYAALPFPITIAVLPRLSHSKDCAYVVRQSGKELILHQPMQAHNYPSGIVPNPGPGAILPDMSTSEIAITIKENLDEIGPGVRGMNNHEGSLITENKTKIGAVLEVANERGIYFLDSRTSAQTSVPAATLERDMNYLARFAPFLDNTVDRDAMLTELYKGLNVANKNGYAVIIGHVDKSAKILPVLLSDIYPYLVKAGYVITTPSKLGL